MPSLAAHISSVPGSGIRRIYEIAVELADRLDRRMEGWVVIEAGAERQVHQRSVGLLHQL
jgi:hypothetical protein